MAEEIKRNGNVRIAAAAAAAENEDRRHSMLESRHKWALQHDCIVTWKAKQPLLSCIGVIVYGAPCFLPCSFGGTGI